MHTQRCFNARGLRFVGNWYLNITLSTQLTLNIVGKFFSIFSILNFVSTKITKSTLVKMLPVVLFFESGRGKLICYPKRTHNDVGKSSHRSKVKKSGRRHSSHLEAILQTDPLIVGIKQNKQTKKNGPEMK